jgi:hypothetical protein
MTSRLYRSTAASLLRASPMCLGLILASVSPASSDQAATLTDVIASAYNPTQISALIAVAAGRVETGADLHSQSFEPLQHALEVSNDVAVALLRVLDRTGVAPDRLPNDLALSAIKYHAVRDALAVMNVDDPTESQMVKRAQTALSAGHFSEVEVELRQIEGREVAASGRSTGARTAHRLVAAQARTSLGMIAMMKLEYAQAAEDFNLAGQLLMLAPSEEPGVIQPPLVTATELADAAEPPQDRVIVTDVSEPIDGHEATVAKPPDAAPPAIAHDETAVAPERVVMALVQPTAMKPTAPPDRPKSAPAPITEAVAKLPPAVATLSTDMLQLLLRRGDAMLALGDLSSARLLYARAASAGDARGAIGVAKTYDPSVLSQIGGRGIKADSATAAVWYRKALELGDASAAARLRLLDQGRSE